MPQLISEPTTIEPNYEPRTLEEMLLDFTSNYPNLFLTLTGHPIRYQDFSVGVPVTIVWQGRRTTITT